MNFEWSNEALYFTNRETAQAMMQFGYFLGACDYSSWPYGVHIHYEADAVKGEGLIFIG